MSYLYAFLIEIKVLNIEMNKRFFFPSPFIAGPDASILVKLTNKRKQFRFRCHFLILKTYKNII